MRAPSEIRVTRDVGVEMRDGTMLYADVFRQDNDGKHPVLLQRTPYNKQDYRNGQTETDIFGAVGRGYVVVIQDCRGRYTSDGVFSPFFQEMNDGYDTVEWCAAQPWSDGKVGMFGTSYVGATQWLAAVAKPPSLKCISPSFTASDYYEGWTYQGGAFEWGFMCNWILPYFTAADLVRQHARTPLADFEEKSQRLIDAIDRMEETVGILPLGDFPIDRELSPYFHEWLSHPARGNYWKAVSIEDRHREVEVPAFNHGGWYDIFLGGTIRNFTGVRANGATDAARAGSRLTLGAWTHTNPPASAAGSVDFGMNAGQGLAPIGLNVHSEQLAFFDLWLKGIDNGIGSKPPVKIFVMGENAWRYEHEWPLARTQYVDYFLHSGGSANSSAGDGTLSTERPGDERPDHFLYDPVHPVPTNGGQTCCYPTRLAAGVFDQRAIETRSDVLVFATPPLEREVEVTGPVVLKLWAETTALDTDFTGKLVDVFPDGTVRNLTDGIVRARYRKGTDKAVLLRPGELVEYTIDLWATSNVFKVGHRIGLEVASSNFPRFDRNLNTGGDFATETEMKPAVQTIHHDAEHPSRLILPVIPR
jgi:putative CocE/NonD family hydrolase